MCSVVDSQIERNRTVTARLIDSRIGGYIGSSIVGHPIPRKAVTGHKHFSSRVTWVDYQMQGICAKTTIGIGVVIFIKSRSSIGVVVPRLRLAGSGSLAVMCSVMEDKI